MVRQARCSVSSAAETFAAGAAGAALLLLLPLLLAAGGRGRRSGGCRRVGCGVTTERAAAAGSGCWTAPAREMTQHRVH